MRGRNQGTRVRFQGGYLNMPGNVLPAPRSLQGPPARQGHVRGQDRPLRLLRARDHHRERKGEEGLDGHSSRVECLRDRLRDLLR